MEKLVLELKGRSYERWNHDWCEVKTHIVVAAVIANSLDRAIRRSPELIHQLRARDISDLLPRHQRRLNHLGISYKGAGPSGLWHPRTARCWGCHSGLDSDVNLQCYACRWILCWCRACGCGYHGPIRKSWRSVSLSTARYSPAHEPFASNVMLGLLDDIQERVARVVSNPE
jgi:hypothetical protein